MRRPRFDDRHLHTGALIVWAPLLIPTVLWWKTSILWVGFMSWYAIMVSHFAGLDAARAEHNSE